MKTVIKKKRRYTRLIDLVLTIILAAICCYTVYKCYALQMIPFTWLLLGGAACLIIVLIFVLLLFLRTPTWGIVLKRIVLLILCGAIGFGGYSIGNVNRAVEQVSVSEDTSTTTKVHLIASKTSGIKKTSDIKTSFVGVQIGTDTNNSEFAKQQLEKSIKTNINYEESLDYTRLTTFLMDGTIDCMIISDSYLEMMNANIEGFKESYVEVTSYENEKPINPSDRKDISKESFTLLISGVDETGAADQSSLSDVNILLFVNPVSNQITMTSIPRDSFIPHYALNNANDKLTHTGSYGVEDTMTSLENFFNIDIDYYAKVSFTSLIEIVDALNGIEVDVEISFEEQDENRSFDDSDLIKLEAGVQHLNGKQALAYARHRKTYEDGVAGRERAQERIIKAIIDKLLTVEGVTMYANKLMEVVPKYVVTNMPSKQITSFIKGELQNIKPWGIQSLTVENGLNDSRPVPNLSVPQSVYLWNRYDYRHILEAYEASKANLEFEDFNFDLNDYAKYLPAIKNNPNIVWDTNAVNPY